jgi:metal-responsive CopG/Arc/MetJ family transcriptional regulator
MAEKKQVNVDFSNYPELLDNLDKMVEEDGTDRSKLIRKLVRQEKVRRDQQQLPLPFPEPKKPTKSAHALAA